MKITIMRAGENLVIEGEITTKGTRSGSLVDMQVTGEDGQPWAEIVMEIADAIEVGAWGVTAWAEKLRDQPLPPKKRKRT